MANTGRKIVVTLKEVYTPSMIPTGQTKPNVPGDPDYVPPSTDLTACPISYSTTCPIAAATGSQDSFEYEFSLNGAVFNNPNIKKVHVELLNFGVPVDEHFYNMPVAVNWFHAFMTPGSGNYTLNVSYLDINDAVLATCVNLVGTITVT